MSFPLHRQPNLRPQPCTRCIAEADSDEYDRTTEAINLEWLPCAICGEPTCADHGRVYLHGYEHEDCHEREDFTRVDDGDY